jgi:hypothetical protein
MSTIYTRATKGSALTWTEGDANINNLNTDKLENIVADTTPQLGGNLDVNGNSIVSTSNGDIVLAPNGTGVVSAQADLVVGYGTTAANVSSLGAYDLVLSTNEGTNSGTITITDGTNGNITIEPNGTGDVHLVTDAVRIGDLNTEARISTYGTGNLVLTTNEGNDPDPTITIGNGANADITLTPSGTGMTMLNNIEYHEKIHALGTTGGTIAPNVANGNVQTITLNAALTMNAFTSPVAGQSLTLIINGGTAYTSITSTMKFAGGIKTLTGTAGCVDILSVFYDGTTYFASLNKGFA